MDIAALSMSMAQERVMTEVGTAILSKAIDQG
ncbi:MAG: YjfB family protein, partial [Parasporobacterium sp.]|nr:YjfB family protein [Parasporobacterium sp.]